MTEIAQVTIIEPQMKPQDTVIYLLGELKGEVGSLRQSIDSHSATQTLVNAANDKDHIGFRKTLTEHSETLAVLNSRQPVRVHWTAVSAILIAVAAIATTIIFHLITRN